eukprot:TRINITY_DN20661_c0_g1_i1.p1 TRINITY_DN20661_c0_g1~~TRINITY_DN20661_c0_g1_i1.p1  ORF type:complete len:389 (+),score=66.94 TRINITY_DN20661_c0_g1_i1:41-1207(+)
MKEEKEVSTAFFVSADDGDNEEGVEYVGKVFPIVDVPRDSEGFVKAFRPQDSDGYCKFFREYGFVVIENVLSKAEIDRNLWELWAHIEKISFVRRNDPTTWGTWPGLSNLGLLSQALTDVSFENRANPTIYEIFKNVLEKDRLWVSYDNYGVLRPTKNVPQKKFPEQDQNVFLRTSTKSLAEESADDLERKDFPEWKSKSRWLHWDLNPFCWAAGKGLDYQFMNFISENNGTKFTGTPKVQGLLNFVDNRAVDGGFCTVPGFSGERLREWIKQEHLHDYNKEQSATLDFVYVPKTDPLQRQVQAIPMRAGSLLIWNSEQPHCNFANDSDRFRMVQYIKMFDAHPTAKFADSRKRMLLKHVPLELRASATDQQNFILGLKDYPDVLQSL